MSNNVSNVALDIDKFSICTFYHLINLFKNSDDRESEFINLKNDIRDFCVDRKIKGTILVANDGINGTVSGSRESMKRLLDYAAQKLGVERLSEYKFSQSDFVPFSKMKVIIRSEVVAMRSDIELDLELKPQDTNSEEWNDLLDDDEVQLIDTRNDYEYEIGTFKDAINPNTQNFREFKDYLKSAIAEKKLDLNKKTAIFCTGGIRCEKAGIYMKNIGFKNVYQLKGGILKYFEDTKNQKNNWIGDCFVFDDRVTVKDDLEPGDLRCIHCLDLIETIEEKRSVTKGRVICNKCNNKQFYDAISQSGMQDTFIN